MGTMPREYSQRFEALATATNNLLGGGLYIDKLWPVFYIESDYNKKDVKREFSLRLNSNIDSNWVFQNAETTINIITMKYDVSDGENFSNFALRRSTRTSPIKVNTLVPYNFSITSLEPVPADKATESVGSISGSIFQKWKGSSRFLGIVGDPEEMGVVLNYTLEDNYFNRMLPYFEIEENSVKIKFNGENLYKPDLYTYLDVNDTHYTNGISFDTLLNAYVTPWENGTVKGYRFANIIGEFRNHSSEDDINISQDVTFYNEYIFIANNDISPLDPTTFSINGKTLSWKLPKNASRVSIYVDGLKTDIIDGQTSWTIPDELYYDQLHTYSISVDDWMDTVYYKRTVSGNQTTLSTTTFSFPAVRESIFYIYKGVKETVSCDAWRFVGKIVEPGLTAKWDSLNQITFTGSSTALIDPVFYYYRLYQGNTLAEEGYFNNDTYTFSNLFEGDTYYLELRVEVETEDGLVYSDPTGYSFTPTKYPSPTITNINRTAINSYSISFSSPVKPDRYDVWFNDVIYRVNATSPINIVGWKPGLPNKVKVECVFEADKNYNNSVEATYDSSYTPILKTPVLNKRDVKENNIEQVFGETKEILSNVTTSIELYWQGVEYASGYILTDKYKIWDPDNETWNEGTKYFPPQTNDTGTEYFTSTVYRIYMDNSEGYHDYSIRAISSSDEGYNSNESNVIKTHQNFPLEPPILSGDSTTTTVEITGVENADFYSLQLVPTYGTTSVLFRSFTPKEYPYRFNYYDMVKDLTQSESFTISAFSRSYNAFYFHPSEDSETKLYLEVIKLDKPVNLQFNFDTSTLTWNGDSRAFQYEVKIKASDGDWVTYYTKETSYTFEDLAPALYTVYVTALRNDESTNNQPVYLDSLPSELLPFGTLNAPKNFSRFQNVLSWDSVGADRYVLYQDGVSLTTVDGGGTSISLGMSAEDKYRPTPGTHTYYVQAYKKVDDGEDRVSPPSQSITVDIVYLTTPEISYTYSGQSHITWEINDSSVEYDLRVNNLEEATLVSNNYSLVRDEPGTYNVKVRAISTLDPFLFQTSEFSNELKYNVLKLTKPVLSLTIIEDVETGISDYRFSWTEVNNSEQYILRITEQGEPAELNYVNDTYYLANFPAGNFFVDVIASGSTNQFANPRYISSEPSNLVKFGKLEAPIVSLNNNVVSWNINELADYYEIYNYQELFAETDDNSFTLDVSKPYSYSISVRAVSKNEDMKPSDASSTLQYTVIRLNSPTNVKLTENMLSWDISLNATGYRVYINDTLTAITASNKYDLKDVLSRTAGIVKVYVTAISDKINHLESEPSAYILKRIEKSKMYNIVLDGVNYDEIQLPFSVHETLDETLDAAGVTLAYIDRREPFERMTPATIIIYEADNAVKSYDLIVESDVVNEVQIGTEIKYKHTIQLIEKTLILQHEIIPNFTVTASVIDELSEPGYAPIDLGGHYIPGSQLLPPGSYVLAGAAVGGAVGATVGAGVGAIAGAAGGAGVAGGAVGLAKEFQQAHNILGFAIINRKIEIDEKIMKVLEFLNIDFIEDLINSPRGIILFTGIGGKINGDIKNEISAGEEIFLPVQGSRMSCVVINIQDIIMEFVKFGAFGATASLYKNIYSTVEKLIKAIRGEIKWWEFIVWFLLNGVPGFELFIKANSYDNNWPRPPRKYYLRPHHDTYEKTDDEELIADIGIDSTLKASKYTFTKEGVFDLVLEIPGVDMLDLQSQGKIDLGYYDVNEKTYFPLDLAKLSDGVKTIDYMLDTHPLKFDLEASKQIPYRAVWHNIEVKSSVDRRKFYSISDVLEKVALLSNKYTIDPVILALTSNIKCPDMTFKGSNYIYDVLEEIGREFNGIPRLLENNVITFDILAENTASSRNVNNWVDRDVFESFGEEMEKVSSGFVSMVSNMVPEDDYTIYPAPGMWCYAKGDEETISTIDISNLSVLVDKPIYKIRKVLVKNAISGLPDYEIDITDNVYQDVVYASLNDNADGKGLALVWSQGQKSIRGLGQLPEVTKAKAAFGFSATTYVLEEIIQNYIDNNLQENFLENYKANNPNDVLFQIEYQGYNDTTLYIENPDKRDNKYNLYKVFNQDETVVSDSRFSKSALTQLKRHGGKIVQKQYKSYSTSQIPQLGVAIVKYDKPYFLDEVVHTFHNEYIISSANFTKNYNKINPRMSVDSNYREYELTSNSVVRRIMNFNNYCYIGDSIENDNADYVNWNKAIFDSLTGNPRIKPDSFYLNAYNSLNLDKIKYTSGDRKGNITEKTIEGIAVPVSYSVIGSSIMMNANLEDEFAAGRSVERKTSQPKNETMVQSYVRYVGENSQDQVPYLRITLGSLPNSIKDEAYKTYPSLRWYDQPQISLSNVYFSEMFQIKKDQREALGFNYQLHFVSNRDNLFIYPGFTKHILRQVKSAIKDIKPILVGYSSNLGEVTHLKGNFERFGEVEVENNSLIFKSNNIKATNDCRGLAIIWPDTNEILFEIRQVVKSGEEIKLDPIYFNFSHKILN